MASEPPLMAVSYGSSTYESLVQAAAESPRRRAHLNIHADLDEPCQRMLVGMQPDSYVRPHRHLIDPKPETLFSIAGTVGVLIFGDDGQPEQTFHLSPEGDTNGCNIPAGAWHSIVSLESDSVFLETKPGPYRPFHRDDFAKWAPEEDFADYHRSLRSLFQ